MKTKLNGPLFIAPRDENGNRMIWDEKKREYVKDEVIYAKPLFFAPIDKAGNKMIWDDTRRVYISNVTGQVYSTVLNKFVEEEKEMSTEEILESRSLRDENIDDNDVVFNDNIDMDDFVGIEDLENEGFPIVEIDNDYDDDDYNINLAAERFNVLSGILIEEDYLRKVWGYHF